MKLGRVLTRPLPSRVTLGTLSPQLPVSTANFTALMRQETQLCGMLSGTADRRPHPHPSKAMPVPMLADRILSSAPLALPFQSLTLQ